MNIISVTNPRYVNAAQTLITADVTFEGMGSMPFGASPNDSEAHGRALFAGLIAGTYGPIAAFIGPTVAQLRTEKLASLEASRDAATLTNVTAHGRQWQADERSQRLLSSAIILSLAGAPLPAVWRDATNNDLAIITVGQLVTIAAAMAVQTQTAYTKSWAKKSQADAALNPADVSLVVW